MSKEQLDDAKKKTNLNVNLVGAVTLPDISATTPKVSLFEFQSMGQELITASVKQTEKFSSIAAAKVGFMKMNQERADPAIKFTPCVVSNATGVRLSLKPFTGQTDYPAPSLIEPGECASFLAPGEAGTITYEVQVFEGPFAGWKAPDKAGDPPKDVEIPPFKLTYPVAGAIKYGDKIKLVNQYTDKTAVPNAGYLDTYENLGIIDDARAFGVQTSAKPNRDNGSGTWEVVRDDLSSGSDPVSYGDKIKLVNQYTDKTAVPNAGYLDTYKNLGIIDDARAFGVQTSAKPNRDNGSGTWEVVRDDLSSGSDPVSYGDKIKLVNQYTDKTAVPNAGYLDSYKNLGIIDDARAFGVQTSAKPNRDNGSGTWQLIAATSSVSPSTALAFVQDMKNPDKPFETTLTWTTNGQAKG